MILASSVYNDVQHQIQKEGGELTFGDYNRLSRLAELRLLYWITGDIKGGIPPEPYLTQKNKDFVAPLITKYKANLDSDGQIARPADYYSYENMYALSLKQNDGCDDEGECGEEDLTDEIEKHAIEVLDGQQFYNRVNTYIRGLKPTEQKPIAKEVGRNFEFYPTTLAAVTLEYIRYPVFAQIIGKDDTEFNVVVPDETASTNYEWDEGAREMLVFIICDLYSNAVRENALKTMNAATGKTING